MQSVHVERLDHLGLIVSMIKDVGLISMIDARLGPDAQEEITPGDAVAGMILNGLGFANKPLTLTPQFFANTPLDLLFRAGQAVAEATEDPHPADLTKPRGSPLGLATLARALAGARFARCEASFPLAGAGA